MARISLSISNQIGDTIERFPAYKIWPQKENESELKLLFRVLRTQFVKGLTGGIVLFLLISPFSFAASMMAGLMFMFIVTIAGLCILD